MDRRTFLQTVGVGTIASACKKPTEDPVPKETEAERLAREAAEKKLKEELDKLKAEKDKLAAEKLAKEQADKDAAAAAREKVSFGKGWGEFYAGPIATGKNDLGELLQTDEDRNRFRDYVQKNLSAFTEVAIEPAFVPPGVLSNALARVNLTGVDQNNATHRPLVERLNAIEAETGNAYLKAGGKKVVGANLELLDFKNPQVVNAVSDYMKQMAKDYKGLFVLGGANFEKAVYDKGLDPSQIMAMRDAMVRISGEVKNQGKKLVMGDIAYIPKADLGKPGAANNLAAFAAKNCTSELHFYVDPKTDFSREYGDLTLNYYAQQDGANLRFTVWNTPITTEAASAFKTGLGKITNTNRYVAGPNNPDKFFVSPYQGKVPVLGSVSTYMGTDFAMMRPADPQANAALAGKNLRLVAEGALGGGGTTIETGGMQPDGLLVGSPEKVIAV